MDGNNGKQTQFYAAFLLPEARKSFKPFEPREFVSPDKDRIIGLIKKLKGSRFKCFASYDDALKFVTDDNQESHESGNSCNGPSEAPLPFPSLDTKQLNVFKRAIEAKDLSLVKSTVHINPRYLISYYFDSPTILMQGPRYNAVHLAVKSKSPEILTYLLETISSLNFIKKCYPDFDEDTIIERRDHILDLYLNTPDKVNFYTPLHFACKNGSIECIKILISYCPICDIKKRNKQNELPQDVVVNPVLKKEIEQLLESCIYITVSRNDGDFKINEPCFGKQSLNTNIVDERSDEHISAIVGPMSPDKAQFVFERMKSPKCTPEQRTLRLRDPRRGLERVTQFLCHEFNVPFGEYWPFLNDFTDFCTEDGLRKLNQHLQLMHDETNLNEQLAAIYLSFKSETDKSKDDGRRNRVNDTEDDDEEEDEEDEIYYTAPSSPELIQVDKFYIKGDTRGQIDTDVFTAIQMALDQKTVCMAQIENSYPFVCHWFEEMKREKQIDLRNLNDVSN